MGLDPWKNVSRGQGWILKDLIVNCHQLSKLLQDYNKFDLPFPNEVNPIDIGIDITDVLRINDKVRNI